MHQLDDSRTRPTYEMTMRTRRAREEGKGGQGSSRRGVVREREC